MYIMESKFKTPCQCAKCGEVFDYKMLKVIEKIYYGVLVKEKGCPFCGYGGYTPMKEQSWLNGHPHDDKKTNKNKKKKED